jgi:hypothetical protein
MKLMSFGIYQTNSISAMYSDIDITFFFLNCRGECSSTSSSKRKNKDRCIGSIDSWAAKKIGYKCDTIFCKTTFGHDDTVEYGASEAGKDFDGEEATKRLKVGFIKLPKCLKGMLDVLERKMTEK